MMELLLRILIYLALGTVLLACNILYVRDPRKDRTPLRSFKDPESGHDKGSVKGAISPAKSTLTTFFLQSGSQIRLSTKRQSRLEQIRQSLSGSRPCPNSNQTQ